jgi:hypothetical protein
MRFMVCFQLIGLSELLLSPRLKSTPSSGVAAHSSTVALKRRLEETQRELSVWGVIRERVKTISVVVYMLELKVYEKVPSICIPERHTSIQRTREQLAIWCEGDSHNRTRRTLQDAPLLARLQTPQPAG